MKHQTINLVKFKALSKRLDLPLCWTVGLLESLWLFACHNARDGHLHRFTALELAGWLEFPGSEHELIEALLETRWIDRDINGWLSIHDWDEHKPNWLKGNEKHKLAGAPSFGASSPQSCEPSNEPSSLPSSLPSKLLSSLPSSLPPNQTKPNPPKPNETTPSLTKPNQTKPNPDGWREVVSELVSLGIGQPERACEAARLSGCLPNEAMAAVRHFQATPGAWGAGLLYKIIEHLRPDRKVSWPQPCPEFQRKQAAAKNTQATVQQVAERNGHAENRKKLLAEQAALEAEFGAALDAIKKPELRELVAKVCPALSEMVPKRGPTMGLLRNRLLAELSEAHRKPAREV